MVQVSISAFWWLGPFRNFDFESIIDVAAGIELRILPLGDSITYGYQPTDDGNQNNGYRLQLLKDLAGSNVKFVGSVRSGTMSDSRNEGHSGATIKQTEGFADLSLNQRPNVILIHIGTNDLNEDPPKDPYEAAPERLDSLLSKIIDACPDATILVAPIIRIKDFTSDARVQAYNNIAAIDFSSVQANDLADGLHPTNDGYAKMGNIWFSAIQSAASKGWIKAPVEPDASVVAVTGEKQKCLPRTEWPNTASNGYLNGAKPIASGGGPSGGVRLSDLDNDGKAEYLFVHDGGAIDAWFNGGPKDDGTWIWIGPTRIASGVRNANQDTVIFADTNGDGSSDYLVKGPEGSLSMWLNTGDIRSQEITWIPAGEVATGLGSPNISLADISGDGDGVEDHLFIDQMGILTAYVNGGPSGGGNDGWIWYPQGDNGVINTGIGATQDQIRLADINGDKKVDYLAVNLTSGAVTAYLNGGRNPDANKGWVWLPQGVIATGIGRDGKGVQFAESNTPNGLHIRHKDVGDKEADYIWISEKGDRQVYLNVIDENPAKFVPYNDGKLVATGVGGSRDEIRLADINVKFGSLTNSGRADYIPVVPSSGAITPWLNGCKNPTNTPSDGETAEGDDPTRDPGNSSGQDGTEEAEGGREGGGALIDSENETTDDGIKGGGEADDESDPVPAPGGMLGGASNGAGRR
ncbi:MAG: hypothetical protein Q9215_005033 [Flavoplaca cf. flavocitrina]